MAKIYGQLEKAQLENVSSNPTLGTTGLIQLNTVSGEAVYDDGTAIREVVNKTKSQKLTNKIFDDAVLYKKISSPATPASGYQSLFAKSDNLLYSMNDAGVETPVGSGGGEYNFIATKQASDWAGYDDTGDGSTTFPFNGTGGTATGVTVVAATSPISSEPGVINIKFSKDAANRQGKGRSLDFSTRGNIDKSARRVCKINVESTTNYADGDVICMLYDTTNSRLIYPSDQRIFASSFVSSQQFEFQLSPDSTAYRLILHVASTNASAYELNAVVKFVETKKVTGGIVNWPSYALTVTGTNWTTKLATAIYYKTINGSHRLRFNASGSVSVAVSSLTLTLSGVTFKNTANHWQAVTADHASGTYSTSAYVNPNASTVSLSSSANISNFSISGDVELESMPTWAVDYNNQVLSEDAGNIPILAKGSLITSAQSLAADGYREIIFNTETHDTTNSFDTSTGRFTAPESGYYKVNIDLCLTMGATAPSTIEVHGGINGSHSVYYGYWLGTDFVANKSYPVNFGDTVYLPKGQYFSVFVYSTGQTISATHSPQKGFSITIEKIQTPQQIAASAKVYEYREDASGQTITNDQTITWDTLKSSSHSALTSAGVFTAPRSGIVRVESNLVTVSDATPIAGEVFYLSAVVNSTYHAGPRFTVQGTTAMQWSNSFAKSIYVNKGDTIVIKPTETIGTSLTAAISTISNWVSFTME